MFHLWWKENLINFKKSQNIKTIIVEKELASDDSPTIPNTDTWICHNLPHESLSSPNYNLNQPLKQNYRDLGTYSVAIQDE